MQKTKIRSYVGFAVKAGKAKIGVDNILSAKKPPFVVLYDPTLSENSKNKLLNKCESTQKYCLDLSEIVTVKKCLAIGICENNLAKAIINEMEENS